MGTVVNFIVIIAPAVLASIAFSAFWYAPRVFGDSWMTLADIRADAYTQGRRMMLYTAFANCAIALTLFIILIWARAATAQAGLIVGVWVGCGLGVMTLLVPYLWEKRPAKLFLIVAGNNFCSIVLMCTIMAHLIGKFYL